jgi:tetratricopeptide (TPR) repeat protein
MQRKGVVYLVIALVVVIASYALRDIALEGVIDRCDTDGGGAHAISACTELIRRDPTDRIAYYNRGNAYQELDAEKSLRLQPADARAVNTRGYLFEALGRTDDAIADFRQSLSQNPKNQDSQQALKRLNASP